MVHILAELEFLGPPKIAHPDFLGRGLIAPYLGCSLIWGVGSRSPRGLLAPGVI